MVIAGLLGSVVSLSAAYAASPTIQVWHYWSSGGELQAINALLAEANKQHPDTPVEGNVIPGGAPDLEQQLQVAVLGGAPPAIYQTNLGRNLKDVVDSGRLQPLDDVWKEVDGDKIYPAAIKKIVEFDGKPWAMPVDIGIISNVYYNKKIFDDLKLAPPTSWDEWDKVCDTVEKAGKACLGNGAGPSWSFYNFYASILSTMGVDGYYAIASGKVDFTGPEFKKALEHFEQHFGKHYMPNWTGGPWTNGADALVAGDVAMYMVGDWGSAYIKTHGFTPGKDYDVFPAPGIPGSIIQPDGIAMDANIGDDATASAKNFLRTVASVPGQVAFNTNKGAIAANLDAPSDMYDYIGKKAYARLKDPQLSTFPNLLTLLPASISRDLGTAIEKFAANPTDAGVAEAGKTMEALRQKQLAGAGFTDWE